jgi:prophage DNA circulation protein
VTWRENLRPASFRGVQFHVRDRGLSTGREIHNHEYPKRNSNFPEDMGKKTRTFSVDAYVLGDDYMSKRDALFRACEREGAAQFVDHWGKSQRVVCTGCELKETSDEGRIARFSLSFMEAGAGAMPLAIVATAARLAGAAGGAAAGGLVSRAISTYNAVRSR